MTESVERLSLPKGPALLLVLLAALAFLTLATGVAFAQPSAQAADGEALFKEKCVACHTIGGGKLVGPDLQGVTERQDPVWLKQWILAPDQVLASGDPIATGLFKEYNNVPMPNLGLTPDQVDALLAYLGGGATTGGAGAELPAGDAVSGKAYFVGDQRFSNGGPHCISCHSVAGLGSLGGGNLGPDLTNSGYTQSETAFASFISAPSTQTMNSIWASTPLTLQEQADLYAFLSKAAIQQREPSSLLQIALLAILGAALLIALANLYWGKRLRGVRKPMVERARAAAKR
ncbi:MAG: cytochrome c [Anaerolineales bacterium]|nr:cytochrome c [Anaerolineales bacterium]